MVGRKLVERLLKDGRLGKSDITKMTLHDVVAPAKPEKPGFPVEVQAGDFAVPGAAEKLIAGRPDVDLPSCRHRLRRGRARFRQGLPHQSRRHADAARRHSARRRRLQAARGVHVLDRGVRCAVPRRDRRRILPHAAAQLRHAEGHRRTADLRLFAQGIPGRHRHPPADHLHPPGRAEQGGLGLLLQHPARAARRQGSHAAGVRGRAPLARDAALRRRLPAACSDDGSCDGRSAPRPHHAGPVRDRRRADRRARSASRATRSRRASSASRIPSSWGSSTAGRRNFETKRARALGFTTAETTFDDIIKIHIEDELGGKFVN